MRINPYQSFNINKRCIYNAKASCNIYFGKNGDDSKNNIESKTSLPGHELVGFYKHFILKKPKIEANPLDLDANLYLIRMDRYSNNHAWAQKMNGLTYKISEMISNDEKFSDILSETEDGVRKIRKKKQWGKKRTESDYYELGPFGRGNEYWPVYLKLFDFDSDEPKNFIKPMPSEEYKDANTCLLTFRDYPRPGVEIEYGWNGEKSNIKLAKKEYKKLKKMDDPSLEDINRCVATIHWLIAQETPYQRGSDSIANVLTKSIYHAYGVKMSPIKEGKSFDFEAFYRDLDDYIRIYPTLFEQEPKFLQNQEEIAI